MSKKKNISLSKILNKTLKRDHTYNLSYSQALECMKVACEHVLDVAADEVEMTNDYGSSGELIDIIDKDAIIKIKTRLKV